MTRELCENSSYGYPLDKSYIFRFALFIEETTKWPSLFYSKFLN